MGKLDWTYIQADEGGFARTPVILEGDGEVMLLGGGFRLSDGHEVAEALKKTGKPLKTIFVSQSDPDFYFSLGPIKKAFPDADVLATPETLKAIEANVDGKLKTWGPKLGEDGPQTRADLVLPKAFHDSSLELEGTKIEIVEANHLGNRRYLWVPDLKAVFGGVLLFSGVHVFTADTGTPEKLRSWLKDLDDIAARKPDVVVPAHAAAGFEPDASAIAYTREYLQAFLEESAKADDSATLIAAMKKRYPDAGSPMNLELGAKVATGEMTWG